MSRWQPSLVGEVIGPGTASTTLINSEALWAVLSEPLRKAASTTMVARDKAAISRFLVRNLSGRAFSLGITSEIREPLTNISSNNLSLPAG